MPAHARPAVSRVALIERSIGVGTDFSGSMTLVHSAIYRRIPSFVARSLDMHITLCAEPGDEGLVFHRRRGRTYAS